MKKVKILRIITRLNIGGPALHVILLSKALNNDRYESKLVCGAIGEREGDMSYYAAERGIKPYFIPELKRELNLKSDIIAFAKIYKMINFEKPDIIHTHTAKAGALGRLAGIIYNILNPASKVKLVHTFHGHIFYGYFPKFTTKLFIWLERFLAFFSSSIVTVSESIKKELISLRISNKISVIPLGLELDKFLNLEERKENNHLNIGIIGRLTPIKNHRLFLDSAAKLLKERPDCRARFKIIGDGELRKDLEEHTKNLGIAPYVDFLGWQKDLRDVYSELDIVALTSNNEGTPLSLIEAMAAGKVIVATEVGGVIDLLGNETNVGSKPFKNYRILERGIIVRPNDSDSFASAIDFISQYRGRIKDMSSRGRNFVMNNFSKENLINNIDSLYSFLLK